MCATVINVQDVVLIVHNSFVWQTFPLTVILTGEFGTLKLVSLLQSYFLVWDHLCKLCKLFLLDVNTAIKSCIFKQNRSRNQTSSSVIGHILVRITVFVFCVHVFSLQKALKNSTFYFSLLILATWKHRSELCKHTCRVLSSTETLWFRKLLLHPWCIQWIYSHVLWSCLYLFYFLFHSFFLKYKVCVSVALAASLSSS